MTARPVLVIGATGKTGRRVAARLAAAGQPVRPGSRAAAIPFDWGRPESWEPALDGVGALYVSYHPDLAAPGAPDRIAALVARAAAAGAERLVLLSGRGEHRAALCERIVAESGLAHTLVRAAWFAQNFSEGALRPAVMAGEIALPAGGIAEPVVDAEDIADVAAAALTEPGHAGQLYEVTGPRLMSFSEIADTLAAASGRRVVYRPVGLSAFRDALAAHAGAAMADLLAEIAAETLDGSNAWVGDGVRRALGRPARDFADHARAAAAAGAWRDAA